MNLGRRVEHTNWPVRVCGYWILLCSIKMTEHFPSKTHATERVACHYISIMWFLLIFYGDVACALTAATSGCTEHSYLTSVKLNHPFLKVCVLLRN